MKTIFTFSKPAVTVILALAALQGCAKSNSGGNKAQNAWVTHSPLSAKEAGFILHSTKNEIQIFLNTHPGVQARELNPAHGLFEIRNATLAELEENFSVQDITKNKLHTKLAQSSAPDLQFFEICRPALGNEQKPVAKITVKTQENTKLKIFNLAKTQSIRLSAEESADTGTLPTTPPTALLYNWAIQAGNQSALDGLSFFSKEITLNLDKPGTYRAYLIVRNHLTGVCSGVAEFQFGVTQDQRFLGKNAAQTQIPRESFEHLALIHAEDLAAKATGQGTKIAVLDSGTNYNHPDLSPNMALNENEIPENGIDDDGNGFTDDYVGFDFVQYDHTPNDDTGHGTHVAGLAAGAVGGVAPQAQIISVKVLNALGEGDTASILAGIYYAVDAGAQVLCLSFSGNESALAAGLAPALRYAKEKNVVLVAAAGNRHQNIDEKPQYPASMPDENLIAVASASSTGDLEAYSSYGPKSVHLSAPGGSHRVGQSRSSLASGLLAPDYLSGTDKPKYIRHLGTSMATPLVAGAVALLKQIHPSATPQEIRNTLMQTGTPSAALVNVTLSGKMLNVDAALSLVLF